MAEKYACKRCDETGYVDIDDRGRTLDVMRPCPDCDGIGITAIDCPDCGLHVPIDETVFVAAEPEHYCEGCGDRRLERIAAHRARA